MYVHVSVPVNVGTSGGQGFWEPNLGRLLQEQYVLLISEPPFQLLK